MASEQQLSSGDVPSSQDAQISPFENVKITLHWLDQSRSQRILWLLEELGAPYQLQIYHRDKSHLAPASLKKVHPLGKSPTVTIEAPGLQEPLVLAESANIAEYLVSHFGTKTTLAPKQWKDGMEGKVGGETEAWLRYKFYMNYAEGGIGTLMTTALFVSFFKNVPLVLKALTGVTILIANKLTNVFLNPNFETHLSFVESQLSSAPEGGPFLCGPNLTVADILMSFPLESAATARIGQPLTKEKYPKIWAYLQSLKEQEGYKKAVQKIIEADGKFVSAF